MTVIAWDGESLAVDRMACANGVQYTVSKYRIERDKNTVIVWSGDHEQGLLLASWYNSARKHEDWPEFQKTKDWTNMIVAGPNGVSEFEKEPVRIRMEDRIQAWGSGAKVALGAMHAGVSAEEAVKITSSIMIDCGNGVDVFTWKDDAIQHLRVSL